MILEIETPGASGNATEGHIETGQFQTQEYRLRAEWASAAAYALEHCDPHDAAQLCANILEAMQTEGPVLGDPFGMVASDAAFWADCAPAHELAAYGCAALDRLRGLALGLNTRKRLFAKLWETFDKCDRQAFLSRVDAEGKFLHRGAA